MAINRDAGTLAVLPAGGNALIQQLSTGGYTSWIRKVLRRRRGTGCDAGGNDEYNHESENAKGFYHSLHGSSWGAFPELTDLIA